MRGQQSGHMLAGGTFELRGLPERLVMPLAGLRALRALQDS